MLAKDIIDIYMTYACIYAYTKAVEGCPITICNQVDSLTLSYLHSAMTSSQSSEG